MATFAHALQRAQQVNGVKDMTENHVIELLIKFQCLRVAAKEMKIRIFGSGDLDHFVADLGPSRPQLGFTASSECPVAQRISRTPSTLS